MLGLASWLWRMEGRIRCGTRLGTRRRGVKGCRGGLWRADIEAVSSLLRRLRE